MPSQSGLIHSSEGLQFIPLDAGKSLVAFSVVPHLLGNHYWVGLPMRQVCGQLNTKFPWQTM